MRPYLRRGEKPNGEADATQAQIAREIALRRRAGMSQGAREALRDFTEECTDWRGYCRKCRMQLRGTPAQLRAHDCRE